MNDKEALQIDIEKIIANKAPKFANKIPHFVFRYLKKILHQDDINGLLVRANGMAGLPFVAETMKEFNTGVRSGSQPGKDMLYFSVKSRMYLAMAL